MKVFFTYIQIFISIICLGQNEIKNNYHFDPPAAENKFMPISDTIYYRTFGGINLDEARDFVETKDKGFLLAGTTSSFGDGSTSFYLVKTDSLGIFKWSKTYGSTNNDWCNSLEKSIDNGYVLAGYSNSFSNFDYDGYILKVDSVGNLIWQKTIGENDWDFFYGSCALADSGFLFCGDTYSNTMGGKDAYLCRTNKNGDTIWTKKFGSTFDESFSDVIQIGNSIFACGTVFNQDSLKNMGFILKYDLNGNILDSLKYGNEPLHNFKFNFINKISNDYFLVGGEKVKFSGTNPSSSLLMKIDTAFNFVWDTYSGYQSQKDCVFAFETSYGDFINLNIQDGSLGGKATYVYQLSANSNFVDGATQDFQGNDLLFKGLLTTNNRLAFVGHTSSFGAGSSDFCLVLFKKDSIFDDTKIQLISYQDTLSLSLVGNVEISAASRKVELFPNPIPNNQNLIIKGLKNNDEIELFDMFGIKVKTWRISEIVTDYVQISLNDICMGNYILEVKSIEKIFRFKLIKE